MVQGMRIFVSVISGKLAKTVNDGKWTCNHKFGRRNEGLILT